MRHAAAHIAHNVVWVLTSKRKNMYKELTAHDVAHELSSNESNGFSYHGALALAEYLEQYEEETGEKLELDTVALRCEYDEYGSALEAAQNYAFVCEREEDEDTEEYEERAEEEAREYLEKHTTVIPFSGGIIIQAY